MIVHVAAVEPLNNTLPAVQCHTLPEGIAAARHLLTQGATRVAVDVQPGESIDTFATRIFGGTGDKWRVWIDGDYFPSATLASIGVKA